MKYIKPIMVTAFIASAFADVITTVLAISQNEAIAGRESNPLVAQLGLPIWALLVIKMLMIFYLAHIFNRPDHTSERGYYFWVTFIFYMTFIQFFVSVGNFEVYQNAEQYINLPEPSAEYKSEFYLSLVFKRMILPILMAIAPFLLWEWSFKQNVYKKRRIL